MISLMGNNKKISEKIRTFTYYIPAPPTRRSGYREKEFDNLMAAITDSGFTIKSLQTQAHTGENSSGMWVVCQISGDKNLDWEKLDNLADPLPKEKAEFHPEIESAEKTVELPEISKEEAQAQLENLYSIDESDDKGPKS